MPRYLIETSPSTGTLSDVLRLTSTRFPEIALERRYALGGHQGRDAWTCRADSEEHVRRWVKALGLSLAAVHSIEADEAVAVTGGC